MNLNSMDTTKILDKALAGERLFPEEAIHLCEAGDLIHLGLVARAIAQAGNPADQVGYTVSQTVIYSNVCQPNCPFCRGTVTRDEPEAFTKTAEQVVAEVAGAVAAGATEITLQGGHRIDLPWAYYPGLVRAIKEAYPQIRLQAFSPTEIMVFNVAYQKQTPDVIAELGAAGMDGLLAGGAESLFTRAPEYRALLRGPWSEWFDVVHRCADAGIPVIAPFVFGLGETAKERVGHLYRIRAVQERTSAAGRPAFHSLVVFTLPQPPTEQLLPTDHLVHVEGEAVRIDPTVRPQAPVTGHEYLRMVALARILVRGVPHVQSSFLSQGAKVAQVSLGGGADDLGGTHLEYDRAELAAGRTGSMTAAEMERLITDAGRIPVRR